ncbi:MAG: Asp-tRNA(Asn)/Glu-tRNA(Gln) amidotransferase subunit GatB [Candidatus Liptonbacteria bacterium]
MYKPTIGLEIHVELATTTKMFCDSVNNPDEEKPNTNVCPVCMGHPGTLPTINKKAVEYVIKVGLAIGAKINPVTKFDRKNYFYPDLPKGYQISQYDMPLVVGGELNGVKITRIHLEEDAGKLVHAPDGKSTFVDFNRAGVPLMELVTEPVIHSAAEAVAFAKELQLVFRYLGVSEADLERGQMRADANISMSQTETLGTRTEIKNLNSWSSIEAAINYEIKRQTEVLESGGEVKQETRGWDTIKNVSKIQRSKEQAHDYRYFPEPDLPPFETAVFEIERLQREMPELPAQKRERIKSEYGIEIPAYLAVLVQDKKLAEFFEDSISELRAWKNALSEDEKTKFKVVADEDGMSEDKALVGMAANYLANDIVGLLAEMRIPFGECPVTPENFAEFIILLRKGTITSRVAKNILRKMVEKKADPHDVLEEEGLHTVSDESALIETVREVISENPKASDDYKAGKAASMQFMLGKAMSKLKGRGDPGVLKGLFEQELAK